MNNEILISDQNLKNALGISNFRELSKERIVNLLSALPDKETVLALIEQLPKGFESFIEMFKNHNQATVDYYESIDKDAESYYSSLNYMLEESYRILEDKDSSEEDKASAWTVINQAPRNMMEYQQTVVIPEKRNARVDNNFIYIGAGAVIGTIFGVVVKR